MFALLHLPLKTAPRRGPARRRDPRFLDVPAEGLRRTCGLVSQPENPFELDYMRTANKT